MSRFRDELRLIAAQAPEVDVVERVVRGARRRRVATFGSVAASLAALALGGAVLAGGSGGATISGRIADVLPASGVDPAAYAYYDFCGRKWDYTKNTHTFDGQECAQWRLVTRAGESFRMPEALSVYTEQQPDNYMNTAAPLVISSDGRRVAYYSEKDQKFAVRDLAGGRIWPAPQTVTRETMVKDNGLLRLSPDGRFLGISGFGGQNAVVAVETGQVTEIPAGWWVESVGDGGSPIVVRDAEDRLGRLDGGRVVPFSPAGDRPQKSSEVSADGRTVAYLDGAVIKDNMETHPDDTIVVIDVATGRVLSRAAFADAPKGFRPWRMGGWLSATEVVVTAMADDDDRWRRKDGVPIQGETVYAIDVGTGHVRKLAQYTYRGWAGDLTLPGF